MSGYNPFHEVIDRNKLAELIESMERDGWQGAPLVADGDQLITGAHRYVASIAAGIDAQVVDIRDIYPEWETLHAEFGSPASNEPDYVCAVLELPADIIEMYGIDVH